MINFRKGPLKKTLYKWWLDLEDDRGARAHFRRAKNVQDIFMLPYFYSAYNQFSKEHNEVKLNEQLAMVLGLISHVREEENGLRIAERMATLLPNSKQPLFSELRFRRLLQCDRKELYVRMIRIIRLLNGKCNLYDIAQSCYYWGDKVKRNWALDYFSLLKST